MTHLPSCCVGFVQSYWEVLGAYYEVGMRMAKETRWNIQYQLYAKRYCKRTRCHGNWLDWLKMYRFPAYVDGTSIWDMSRKLIQLAFHVIHFPVSCHMEQVCHVIQALCTRINWGTCFGWRFSNWGVDIAIARRIFVDLKEGIGEMDRLCRDFRNAGSLSIFYCPILNFWKEIRRWISYKAACLKLQHSDSRRYENNKWKVVLSSLAGSSKIEFNDSHRYVTKTLFVINISLHLWHLPRTRAVIKELVEKHQICAHKTLYSRNVLAPQSYRITKVFVASKREAVDDVKALFRKNAVGTPRRTNAWI